jgi:alkylation response protein AidB-like acyl-CoA dehydrogenase
VSPDRLADLATRAELDEARQQLRAEARRYLERHAGPVAARRRLESPGSDDRDEWKNLAQQGFAGINVPEELGGQGGDPAALCAVLEEAGRSLLGGPLLATTALALPILLRLADPAVRLELVPRLTSGAASATASIGGAAVIDAKPEQNGWRLTGSTGPVLEAGSADLMLIPAQAGDGIRMFLVEAGATGLSISTVPVVDPTRGFARLSLSRTPALPLGTAAALTAAADHLLSIAALALSAEMLGAANRCLEMAVSYLGGREAFGRPLASFQALKHRCADIYVDLAAASVLLDGGLRAELSEAADSDSLASLAKAACGEAFLRAASENILLHGGIGFTFEHDAHLFLRRAIASQNLFGDAGFHRRRAFGWIRGDAARED